MNREQIIQIAREAGWPDSLLFPIIMDKLVEFAVLVAAAERNRLADKIEQMPFGDTAASFAVWIRNGSNT